MTFGTWDSPVTAISIQNYLQDYTYLCKDQCLDVNDKTVYWCETRPDENGRGVVVSSVIDDNQGFINTPWTPADFSVKTRVHEYGGAPFLVHQGIVYFSNDSDQRLYKQTSPEAEPVAISSEAHCRYGNGFYSTHLDAIFLVREDHTDPGNVVNTVSVIANENEKVFLQGADFYMSPIVNKSGTKLAWIEWMFPNMPWDNTRCCVACIDPVSLATVPGSVKVICTGTEGSNPISCSLPCWTVDDELLYIKDQTNFWNVWVRQNDGSEVNLTPVDEDIGDPMWLLDYRKYAYDAPSNKLIVARQGGHLDVITTDLSQTRQIRASQHLSYMCYPQPLSDGSFVVIGFSGSKLSSVYRLFLDNDNLAQCQALAREGTVDELDSSWISQPKPISYPTSHGAVSHGYFYAPCNPGHQTESGLPPLLVLAHGGPTAAAFPALDLAVQFWTSRGYGVLDVDYRGSTGYGSKYRNALKGNWGIYDRDDCAAGAEYLVRQGLVDPAKLAIKGGSAGGYLVLCCLTFTDVFRAGSSLYGVADIKTLIENTHKFESRYPDQLIGPYQGNEKLYHDRSPINFASQIKCPVIFFQGDEDRVVLPEQSQRMYEVVKSVGQPTCLVIYEGEQHGFQKLKNIVHQLDAESYFLATVLKLHPNPQQSSDPAPITIINL